MGLVLFTTAFNWALKNWRITLVALAIIAALIWYAHEKGIWVAKGEQEITTKIDNANAEEMRRAQAAAKTVDDCAIAGGDWDRDNGVCNPAAAGK